MKLITPLLLLGLASLPLNLPAEEEIEFDNGDESDRKRAPMICALHREGGDRFSFDLVLKPVPGRPATFAGFQLCVFPAPLAPAELPHHLANPVKLARTETRGEPRATLTVAADEVERAVLLVHFLPPPAEAGARASAYGVPVASLLKSCNPAARRPRPHAPA